MKGGNANWGSEEASSRDSLPPGLRAEPRRGLGKQSRAGVPHALLASWPGLLVRGVGICFRHSPGCAVEQMTAVCTIKIMIIFTAQVCCEDYMAL